MPRTNLLVSQIRRDDGTQSRAATDEDLAGEYGRLMKDGATLPDPVVFSDGRDYWLADGFHTIRGCEIVCLERITVDVRKGTLRDALLFSLGANATHGRRRSHADLRHVLLLILSDAEWGKNPNTWIAQAMRVDERTVRRLKKELKSESAEGDNSAEPRTIGIANGGGDGEDGVIGYLSPADSAAWEAMSPEDQEGIRQRSIADALDERMGQIEVRAARIAKLIGDGDNSKEVRAGLKWYLAGIRASIGWESERQTIITDEVSKQVKAQLDQMRRLHSELPGVRQNDKRIESLWQKVQKCLVRS